MTQKGKDPSLAPAPVSHRWNSYFETVKYHTDNFDVYPEFFKREGEQSDSVTITCLVEMLSNPETLIKLQVQTAFVPYACPTIMHLMTKLETNGIPLAPDILNMLGDLESFLTTGTARVIFPGRLRDLTDDLSFTKKRAFLDVFHVFTSDVFTRSFQNI